MAPHFHEHNVGLPTPARTGPSLPLPPETSSDLRVLDPAALAFRSEGGRFQVRLDGAWQNATLVRLFPLTEPESWLSLVADDGRELGILLEAKGLARADLALLRQELHRRYVVPQIQRILSCRRRGELSEWLVETDRGALSFRTLHLREQIRDPSPRRITLTDVEGNRFDIPDLQALDPESRRRLEAHL